MDIFEYRERFPNAPGYQPTDTSFDAAVDIGPRAGRLRAMVFTVIHEAGERGLTADECAASLGIDKLSIRPRTTELQLLDKIKDSGVRRKNVSGKSAFVWVVA